MPKITPLRLGELSHEIAAATRPITALEKFIAHEIAYASWELERVRANTQNTAAESALNAAYNRATRNWNRARKELAKLQSARVNHATRLSPKRQKIAQSAPLADPARVPQPKLAGPVVEQALTLIQKGHLPTNCLNFTNIQEAR